MAAATSVVTIGNSHFAPEVPTEHLNWIEPRIGGRQIEQHQPAYGAAQNFLDLIILVRGGIVSGDIDCAGRMRRQERIEQFGGFSAALTPPNPDHRLARVRINSPDPIMLAGLAVGRRGLDD
jgi:hypothetical protein